MPPPVSRRSFLLGAAGTAGLTAAGLGGCSGDGNNAAPTTTPAPAPTTTIPVPRIDGPPFTLGVASGDPLPDRVVLWTRLAPKPLDNGSGMPDTPAPVLWEVATDERFGDVVAHGVEIAEPRWSHSVHADAGGLQPDTRYFYRFRVGDALSPVGRTRTAPATGAANTRFRFGFGSCQNYTHGFYTAYPHLVDEDLDLMIWLGDYIYEAGFGDTGLRQHDRATVTTLDDYRARFGLYTGDANLQAARAAQPWVVLWDDHEVVNDYGGDTDPALTPPEQFLARRSAAYQAWWENQPVRAAAPDGTSLTTRRRLDWGGLVRIHALDERQYRSPRACRLRKQLVDDCPDRTDPTRSMLGTEQREWFLGELDASRSRWNLIANEVIMSRLRVTGLYNLDQWDGFAAEQRTIAERLATRATDLNTLVLTGDIHSFGVADVKVDYDDPAAPVVATELVGGSISSNFPLPELAGSLRDQANVHFVDATHHGYAVVDLNADEARCRFRSVRTHTEPTATISTLAEMVVAAGRPGARLT